MALTYLPHIKLAMYGNLGDGAGGTGTATENWTCGLRFHSTALETAPPTVAQLQLIGDAAIGPVTDWFSGLATISTTAKFNGLKTTWITNTGKQRDTNTNISVPASPVAGGVTGPSPIWEQTYALTFRTANNRGRGHSGRIYPPLSGRQPEAGTPYMTLAGVNDMAGAAATLLGALNAAIHGILPASATDGGISVMSAGNTVGGIVPLATRITGVVVDRVADIQHRRTNRVPRAESARSAVV